MTEDEKDIILRKKAVEHRLLITRIRDYIHTREREATLGARNRRSGSLRKKTQAETILDTAEKLQTTPLGWPTISKKAITPQLLLTLHKACQITLEEFKARGETLVQRKWVELASDQAQKGALADRKSQETSSQKDEPATEQISEDGEEKDKNDQVESGVASPEDDPPEDGPPEESKPIKEKNPRMSPKEKKLEVDAITINSNDFKLEPFNVQQDVELRPLSHGLDRVLFNPGVTFLRDPRSKVYNFDPYLDTIMPVDEFDFDALGDYITSSKDTTLKDLAKAKGKKYVGSTSSMTGILSHLHYLLSRWRPITLSMLSKGFVAESENFTRLSRLPVSVILRWKDGVYAIDQDKETDSMETILLFLGRSMEKMLTMPPEIFQKYHKSQSHEIPEEVKNSRERYHYTGFGDLLFRSQLDAHDNRLPGTGVFDLKTRGVLSIRMNAQEPAAGWGYQIKTADGQFESFEREYYDLIRSAFMKYSLQVRMGRMDGCFVAYHNTKRIFGFQYVSIDEMDEALHGGPEVGDQEFKLSLKLLNEALNKATEKYPDQSLRLWFETRESNMPFMYFAAEPLTEEEANAPQKEADLNVVLDQIRRSSRNDTTEPEGGLGIEEARAVEGKNPSASEIAMLDTSDTEREAKGIIMKEGQPTEQEKIESVRESAEMLESVTIGGETLIDPEDRLEAEGDVEAAAVEESESNHPEEEDITGATAANDAESATENAIEPTTEGTAKPEEEVQGAFVQVVVAQSFVNGEKVVRPGILDPKKDNWTVNYAFLDMKADAADKTIAAMKRRKQDGVDFDISWKGTFMSHLLKLSRDGEKTAARQKKADEEGEVVVYRRRD
ncbi:hypothetical protein H072_4903 [Dactylellina haptotyla CBS 200.50]|uniref:Uncharacterized protein n=1 Tax=Dactylellina haptotyla (strain CBS 200.50) TaxID=1284197 RepID=S8AJ57_DACHA|nr:hypothetical protein H072_4903 [Dactylellina haptotyla CBS 200.50]